MSELLAPKCIFCGYNGEGYYQGGTHSHSCPWHSVGGLEEREFILPQVIRDYIEQLRTQLEQAQGALTSIQGGITSIKMDYADGCYKDHSDTAGSLLKDLDRFRECATKVLSREGR